MTTSNSAQPRLLDLPIDSILSEFVGNFAVPGSVSVVTAAPGAGKTTRIPKAALQSVPGKIIVLEPRRLAARLSAERVAFELGEAIGQTCGYQVRFESEKSAATRLIFVTEGIFSRMIMSDPELKGIDAIIIDEFHERHLQTDLALSLTLALQRGTRPDLRLVVMSATMDVERLKAHLGVAKVYTVLGRSFPVDIEYLLEPGQEAPRDAQSATDLLGRAVQRMLGDRRCPGHVLVFLPGYSDIQRAASALQALALDNVDILPLMADLPRSKQALVFQSGSRRKVILATNVAETSLTIPGVTGVIDTGLAKIAGYAAWSGLPTLDLRRIAQASAIQRAGRAGRTAPGLAFRLYSESDFLSRDPYSTPEILRMDLTEAILNIYAAMPPGQRVADSLVALPWFDLPPAKAIASAHQTLQLINALSMDGKITAFGQQLAKLPLHPRLAAIVLTGRDLGIGDVALFAATLLSDRSGPSSRPQAQQYVDCDLLARIDGLRRVDASTSERLRRTAFQLAKLAGINWNGAIPDLSTLKFEDYQLALLAGFADRVGKRRQLDPKSTARNRLPLYNLCLGRGAQLSEQSYVNDAEWLIVLDAQVAQTAAADREATIHLCCRLNAELLPSVHAGFFRAAKELVWVPGGNRVDAMLNQYYGNLFIKGEKSSLSDFDPSLIASMLQVKLKEVWPQPFDDGDALATYHARLGLLHSLGFDDDWPVLEGDLFEIFLSDICDGKRSFKDIRERELKDYINDQLSYTARQRLDELAPLTLSNAHGRKLAIHYEAGKSPLVQGHIQDFFGMNSTPSIGLGRVALTIALTGPNKRPLQVTSDLAGFWRSTYPDIARELSRKYPRHYWPEHPETAAPMLHKPRT